MASARVAALRLLARRRLSQAQLWERLERKGYCGEEIAAVVERCKREGYLDDELFAQLYIEGKRRPLGDARLVGELVRRGIEPAAASRSVERAEHSEEGRLDVALQRALRERPQSTYPSLARRLERLGFPAALIYAVLRRHAAEHGPFGGAPPSDSD